MKPRPLSNPAPITPTRPLLNRTPPRAVPGKPMCIRSMTRVLWYDPDLSDSIVASLRDDPERLIARAAAIDGAMLKQGDRCTVIRFSDSLLGAASEPCEPTESAHTPQPPSNSDHASSKANVQSGDGESNADVRSSEPGTAGDTDANAQGSAKPAVRKRASRKRAPRQAEREQQLGAAQLANDGQSQEKNAALPAVDRHTLVLKRFNPRSQFHTIVHMPLRSRAQWCWLNARRLLTAGLLTPQPLACVDERRMGIFNVGSYLITRFINGTPLREVVESGQAGQDDLRDFARQFAGIWQTLGFLRVGHGDMKATNFIVDPQGRLWLIDLDGMRRYRSLLLLRRERRNDLLSFMHNWRERPDVAAIFRARLGTG